MEFFKQLAKFINKFYTSEKHKISKYVFYKIIDINSNKSNVYIIQCINSKSIFESHINEIVYDFDLLHSLHPLQACFIGIEYRKFISQEAIFKNNINISFINQNVSQTYGTFKIKSQDRKNNLCFIDIITLEEISMKPKEIAFSDRLLSKFHAADAFFIGICAGQEIHQNCNIIPINFVNNLYKNKA